MGTRCLTRGILVDFQFHHGNCAPSKLFQDGSVVSRQRDLRGIHGLVKEAIRLGGNDHPKSVVSERSRGCVHDSAGGTSSLSNRTGGVGVEFCRNASAGATGAAATAFFDLLWLQRQCIGESLVERLVHHLPGRSSKPRDSAPSHGYPPAPCPDGRPPAELRVFGVAGGHAKDSHPGPVGLSKHYLHPGGFEEVRLAMYHDNVDHHVCDPKHCPRGDHTNHHQHQQHLDDNEGVRYCGRNYDSQRAELPGVAICGRSSCVRKEHG